MTRDADHRAKAEERIQELLLEATGILSVVKDLALQHGIEGFSFNGQTFRLTRYKYDERRHLLDGGGWFDDQYWESSTADCEIEVVWGDEEEP